MNTLFLRDIYLFCGVFCTVMLSFASQFALNGLSVVLSWGVGAGGNSKSLGTFVSFEFKR